MNDTNDITLTIDRQTARLLFGVLHNFGEHIAAGQPIIALNAEESELIGRFFRKLNAVLGGPERVA
jgi:hypothetical protein